MSQLYYDIARDQWSAWEQRRKDWWQERRDGPDRGVNPNRRPGIWRGLEFIIANIWYWRGLAAPHGSASRYVSREL